MKEKEFPNLELYAIANECLKNEEFVNQYCRLKNIKRPDRLSPIEKMIDEACGNKAGEDFIRGFVEFVDEFVYKMIPVKNAIEE